MENNIKMTLKITELESVDFVNTVQNVDAWWAFVNTVMSPRIPLTSGNFWLP
jgi:hypothetical protein